MISTDRTAQPGRNVIDQGRHLTPVRQIGGTVDTLRLAEVQVDGPVAKMTEGHRPDARQPSFNRR